MSAEKVDGFPQPRPGSGSPKYPFPEIAEDGGVWRLDPADYDVKKPQSIQNAAYEWALRSRRYKVTTQIHDGCAFVQFTTLNGRAS